MITYVLPTRVASENSAGSSLLLWYMFGITPIDNESVAMTIFDVVGLVAMLFTGTTLLVQFVEGKIIRNANPIIVAKTSAFVTTFALAFLPAVTSFGDADTFFLCDRAIDCYFVVDLAMNFIRPFNDGRR